MTARIYSYKDVDMLLASKTVVKSLENGLAELSVARSSWTPEFVTALTDSIDNAIDNFLGLDKKKELRNATAQLTALQGPALRDLSFIKTQIEVDFGDDAGDMLKALGFNNNLRDAQRGDQEALIQLLYSFKKGMTEELKTQITAKGTNPTLIDRITGYAEQINQANVTQETLKETTKAISEEAVKIFNEIYNEVIGICKIAHSFYQYEPLKRDQFAFSQVVNNMNVHHTE